jgi:hypothetical protein
MARPTIFIRHAPEDHAIAAKLAADLDRVGVAIGGRLPDLHTWPEGMIEYQEHVEPLLAESNWFLYVLTPAFLKSEPLRWDQAMAAHLKKRGKIRDFLYFKAESTEPVDMSWLEDQHHVFDGTVNYTAAVNRMLEVIGLKMPIFICYRRVDSEGYAGRLHDDLVRHFGEEYVFLDLAGIDPGVD